MTDDLIRGRDTGVCRPEKRLSGRGEKALEKPTLQHFDLRLLASRTMRK